MLVNPRYNPENLPVLTIEHTLNIRENTKKGEYNEVIFQQ